MGVRIPPEYKRMAEACGLEGWLKRVPEVYSEFAGVIPAFLDHIGRVAGTDEPDRQKLVLMLAVSLSDSDALYKQVTDPAPIDFSGDAEAWAGICQAAAWTIVQRYEREENAKQKEEAG